MFYEKLTNTQLKKYPYPNLMAELIESGYSICTLGDHMNLGRYLPEDSPEVWGRLTGEKEICASEAFELANLFGAELEYLFSHELKEVGEKTVAYYRWYEWNRKQELEFTQFKQRERITMKLCDRPELGDFIEEILKLDRDKLEKLMQYSKYEIKENAA